MTDPAPAILVIGTGDTKADELAFLADRVRRAGGRPVMLDVSVLGDPPYAPDHDKHAVAAAAGTTIPAVVALGDENAAMAAMADGASRLAARLAAAGAVQGMVAIGGTMATDLALDVAQALPVGFPKVVVSTIAFSHLIPPQRVAADLMMMLWAGGLYGLNATCRSVLAQAAGAVTGAARLAEPAEADRPVVALSSLGKSCLTYMVRLRPELEARGYEVVVFHTTGMGGRALESLARQRRFAAVFDFSLQEVANHETGSPVTSGPDRLEGAGAAGIPQIVAPGAVDMVDFPTWGPVPAGLEDRPYHAHNRLIASVTSPGPVRARIAAAIGAKLARAGAPTAFILPARGIEMWDRPGEPLHEPEALAAFVAAMRAAVPPGIEFHDLDAHINDDAFVDAALAVFDRWRAAGIVPPGRPAG